MSISNQDSNSDSESDSPIRRAREEDSDINYCIYYCGSAQIQCGVQNQDIGDDSQQQQQQYCDYQEDSPSHISYAHSSDLQESSSYQRSSSQEYFQDNMQELEQQTKGLEQQEINQLPKMTWLRMNHIQNAGEQCAICISAFKINNRLRVLNCLHRFHSRCIDVWLQNNNTCPSCRNSVKVPD